MNDSQDHKSAWKLLEHTADVLMEARGKDLEELFANATEGLTSLLSPGQTSCAEVGLDIVVDGDDREQLLVNFLREVLYLNQVKGFVPTRWKITFPGPTRLEARLHGSYAGVDETHLDQEIKGVTYHDLSIREDDNGYSVRIVFDV